MSVKIRNTELTPVADISAQMREPRPLPIGVTEFHEWAERIISGALLTGAVEEDQKYALASMIMSLGPTESHKPDAYFIHCLRKGAVNQIAHAYMQEVYFKKHPEKLAEKLAAEKAGEKTMDRAGATQ